MLSRSVGRLSEPASMLTLRESMPPTHTLLSKMKHKAFLFDYKSFESGLREILEGALVSGELARLINYININMAELRDPYEGEPLDADWESLVETKDAHQYGDFALTRYYDPTADIGLGRSWETVQDLIATDPDVKESPILGRTVGPENDPFDPGKMGSYFQSAEQVRQSYHQLLNLSTKERSEDFEEAVQMLRSAADAKSGLYVTF